MSTSSGTNVLLVGDPGFLDECLAVLKNTALKVTGTTYVLEEASVLLRDLRPEVVLVDEEFAFAGGGVAAGGVLARQSPASLVLLVAERPNVDLWRRCVSGGLRGVVRKPLNAAEVLRAVEEIREEESRQILRAAVPADAGGGQGAPARQVMVARQEVVVCYSPKGGVGKTTLAVNLAASFLNRAVGLRPVVLDFDAYGDVGAMLQLRTPVTVAAWADVDPDVLTAEAVKGLFVRHASGLAVLPAARRLVDIDVLTEHLAHRILAAAKKYFDVVVVDAGPVLRDSTVVAFDHATKILVVATLDVPTLHSVNSMSEVCSLLNVDVGKVRLVLNRIPRKPDLSIREVAELLVFPLVARVPEDPLVQVAGNRGEIMALARPESPFSAEVNRLSAFIVPLATGRAGKGRLFGQLFRFGAARS